MSIDRMIESAKKSNPVTGQWSAPVILGHISQVDSLVWQPRVEQMVVAQMANAIEPTFQWWEPDHQKTENEFSKYSVDEAGALALKVRTQLVTYLNSLSQAQWQSRANHETFGSIDVRDLIMQTLTHDEEHRAALI
jgi:hypothetical protein